MLKTSVLYILTSFFFFSCKKEKGNEPLPSISDTPEITSVTINRTSVNQFDDLIFNINYIDGNGDIGTDDADVKSIFITDKRGVNIVHKFHLQPLSPIGSNVAIQGRLNVTLKDVILLNQANTVENASFEIKIKDRAGNISNIKTTSNVVITQ